MSIEPHPRQGEKVREDLNLSRLKQDFQDCQDVQDEAAATPRIGQGGYPQRANGLARFFCQVDSPGFSPNANFLDRQKFSLIFM